MENRLDVLRGRADFLAQKIRAGVQASRGRDEREHAALMWAIAELSGIGDEYRRMQSDRDDLKAEKTGKLRKRAEHFERLYTDTKLKNVELKTRIQILSDELYRLHRPPAAAAVDPQVTDTGSRCDVLSGGGALVAETKGFGSPAGIANARYIAHACNMYPELLAALRHIEQYDIECACDHLDEDCCAKVTGVDFCAKCFAAAAIAKAEASPDPSPQTERP